MSEGQWVEAGDVLARLDTDDLETALRNAEISLRMQQVSYEQLTAPAREVDVEAAQAAVDAAQASVNSAFDTGPSAQDQEIARLQAELARNQLWQQQLQRDEVADPFVPEGVPSRLVPKPSDEQLRQLEAGLAQSDYQVQMADESYQGVLDRGPDSGSLGSANASLVSAQVQLDRLLNGPSDYDLERAQINLRQAELSQKLAQVNLARATLVAPFAGVVGQVNLTPGELPPNGSAIQLVDNTQYYVMLAIDETEIASVQEGQPVSLAIDALPEATITGRVTRVAQTPTRFGQVVAYMARVEIDPSLEPIRIGMNTTATVKVQQLQDVLVLRNRFIRIDRATQKAYVTIQRDDGRFEEVEVQLGLRNETQSQIVSGLQAGQRVVLLPRGEANLFEAGPR